MPISSNEPVVRLVSCTPSPYDLAIASARTCYSPKAIIPNEVTGGQRQRIGAGIWEAGHHTPFQHATFVFTIENVSRQLVWSLFHSHPYYNSDQTSQRYNVMDEPKAFVPRLQPAQKRIYEEAIGASWKAYAKLTEIVKQENARIVAQLGKVKGQDEKQMAKEAENKAVENSRYVLPVSAFTSLYHTVSGVVLKRYQMMAGECDCPEEARKVVALMLAEAEKFDSSFKMPVPKLPERKFKQANGDDFAKKFDAKLNGMRSRLVAWDENAEGLVADGIREAVGLDVSDDEAIALALSPEKNPELLQTLNSWQHSPITRALNLATYTYRKKISHTCDSQDQRHRTIPATRPLLSRLHTSKPDVIEPQVIAKCPEAHKIFVETCKELWEAKNRLVEAGVPAEDAIYALPNAVALRFTETGRLIDWMHKWRMRTCFNAQQEIYDVSMEELAQAGEKHPRLTKFIGPPCFFRKGLAKPECPEGPRWCGIEVWRNFPKVRRPF